MNISASNETIAKREYRKNLVKHQSAALHADYLYVSAGADESTQDLIFSGHSLLAENGTVINENKDFIATDYLLIADMDLGKIRHDRNVSTTFSDAAFKFREEISKLTTLCVSDITLPSSDGEYVITSKKPFIPGTKIKRIKRCNEIFEMQVGGLAKRLSLTGSKPSGTYGLC